MGRKSDLPFTLNCTVHTKGLLCGEGKEQTLITCLWRAENTTGLFRCDLPRRLHESPRSSQNKDDSNLKTNVLAGPVCPSSSLCQYIRQKRLKEGRAYFGSQLEGRGHHGAEGTAVGHEAAGHIVPRHEAGR